MKKMEQFLKKNPNPVISVGKDGKVLYSYGAGEPLLHEWGVEVGEKLPSDIGDFVQRVISWNSPEKIEIKVGKKVYLVEFHSSSEEECVTIYGFDISDQKELEGKLQESEAWEMTNLELADIIDMQAIKSLMDNFYKLVHIPIGLNDLKGNVLVGVGWQDICTKFHRVHPETCKHCVESNIKLSSGVLPGEFKMYKCKNNMWDIVTPIMVGDQHVGYVFAGQFFFEDEPLDYELFRSHARKYGFNEEEYIIALEKVPRLSTEDVDTSMGFFMTFANMISQLSYNNIKLVKSLAERDDLVDALRESEERFRSVLENSLDAAYRRNLQTDRYDYMSPVVEKITGFSAHEMSARSANEALCRIHPDDRPLVTVGLTQAFDTGFGVLEYRFKHKDGKYHWFADHFTVTKDQNGRPLFSGGIVRDITKSKEAEEALRKTHDNLEKLVEERTAELEKAYISLKESEKGLAEAQEMAHIGNWEWDIEADKAYWSEEMYHIFRRDPQELAPHYKEFLSCVHPDDRDYVDSALKKAVNGKTHSIEYRIVLANGEERAVHMQSEVVFDEKNTPIRAKGIIQDITERKEAEEALENLEIARKKEIHHRIKNNLQVISSLLDLQADKFDNPKVIEAFRESQNRVISMALIHEELYKGEETDTLDFSTYIRELAENLFQTYSLKSKNIRLCMDLEENAFFDMDVAVPLGIIVNELISNSLKHAFPGRDKGEIRIKLGREEKGECKRESSKSTSFTLAISDNGVGIPENFDIEDLDSLGMQLITSLVDQLDGELELKSNNGTEFAIRFTVTEEK